MLKNYKICLSGVHLYNTLYYIILKKKKKKPSPHWIKTTDFYTHKAVSENSKWLQLNLTRHTTKQTAIHFYVAIKQLLFTIAQLCNIWKQSDDLNTFWNGTMPTCQTQH